jgi:hypothetical protein
VVQQEVVMAYCKGSLIKKINVGTASKFLEAGG